MADYKKMYFTLFNSMTEILQEIQEAQIEVEEIYLETDNLQTDRENTKMCVLKNSKKSSFKIETTLFRLCKNNPFPILFASIGIVKLKN